MLNEQLFQKIRVRDSFIPGIAAVEEVLLLKLILIYFPYLETITTF